MSSLPPIFAETQPPASNVMTIMPVVDEKQLDALKENLMSSLEQIQPRIKQLEETFNSILTQANNNTQGIGNDVSNELNKILPRMPTIHDISISSSRRVQSLALNQQTVATLSLPKQLRPVHDDFFAFKEEFDSALKNVATLSRTITSKSDMMSTTLDSLKAIPEGIKRYLEESSTLKQQIGENIKTIERIKEEINLAINESAENISEHFETKLKEAEDLLKTLEDKCNDGINNSALIGEQLQTEKFDMKTSFEDLTNEIEKTMNDKLEVIKEKVTEATKSTNEKMNNLQDSITIELDGITRDSSAARSFTILDEIEQEKEISELEALIDRFNYLEDLIKEAKENPQEGSEEYDDFESEIDNKKVTFRCFKNGKYEIVE